MHVCATVQRAGKATPAVGPRDLPLPEADVRPPPSGKRCDADRDPRMDIVIERGDLRDASASDFRQKSMLIDVTCADPQAGVHLRAGSADQDGTAASTSEARKRNRFARPGHVSFDERRHKLVILAVESFERLGREGSEFFVQLATSDRRKGWGGNAQERHLLGTSSANNFSDLSGCDLTPSSPVQARITGPSRDHREEGRGGGADANDVGFAHKC